ncbi:MAG TPA: hypothetical protein PKL09_02795 [bacterium]|nr:hypothetical protein [bacterium]HNS34187.1 hypothetical protein [bacterium]HNZ73468.1 hypothetical protein [bacterium]HOH67397.1 hypothetical protein [bacterium]
MEIEINFSSLFLSFQEFASQDPITIAIQLFLNGGWVIFLLLLIYGFYQVWLNSRQGAYAAKWKHILLAIDIPKNNEQSTQAVENIFVALAGAQSSGNLIDRYWHGKIQESFSFELVGLEGYVQFLVRTPSHFRDLVEAAIYSQYPEAEITEVEDYTADYYDHERNKAKIEFPHDKYNLWGTEFVLVKDYPYPFRTYSEFENTFSQSFADPMANLLEVLGRFGPGEQLWLQLVVTPQKPGWGEKAKKIVKEMKGESYSPPETIMDKAVKPVNWLGTTVNTVVSSLIGGEGAGSAKKDDDQWKMFKLSPGERQVFERVQRKLSKHSFRVKFRVVYLADKEVFNKPKGVAAVIGSIQQFNSADANGFKPGDKTKTAADYFRVKARVAARQNKIFKYFCQRSNYYGESVSNMFLSSEELATLWHFPLMTVKPPAIEKISSRKVVPPSRLPYEQSGLIPKAVSVPAEAESTIPIETARRGDSQPPPKKASDDLQRPIQSKPAPPANLPTV